MSQILPAGSQIHETVGYTIKQDVYGLDTLTRNFEGPDSDWLRFVAAYPVEAQDYQFKDYYLVSRDAGSRRGSVITPVLTFKGVAGLSTGKFAVTRAQKKKSLVTKQVTLKLSDGSGRTIEIEYKAPSTTWTYATGYEPTVPLYKGFIGKFDEDYQLVRARGATQFPLDFVTGPRPATFNSSPRYLVYTQIFSEQFDCQQVGKAWTVTERNDGYIIGVEQQPVGTTRRALPSPIPTGT